VQIHTSCFEVNLREGESYENPSFLVYLFECLLGVWSLSNWIPVGAGCNAAVKPWGTLGML